MCPAEFAAARADVRQNSQSALFERPTQSEAGRPPAEIVPVIRYAGARGVGI